MVAQGGDALVPVIAIGTTRHFQLHRSGAKTRSATGGVSSTSLIFSVSLLLALVAQCVDCSDGECVAGLGFVVRIVDQVTAPVLASMRSLVASAPAKL
jgi:hypothetical protein